ncbi:MAG: hypothetical protein ACM31C_26450 [Acidobacteriota bacterium]
MPALRPAVGIALAFALASGCDRDSTARPQARKAAMSDVRLDFTLTKTGGKLHVAYRLTNGTNATIYVADQLLAYHEGKIKLVPERMIVVPGDTKDTVRLVRAMEPTDSSEFQHPPGAAPLAAGATRDGTAELELPLQGWHNYGESPELPGPPKQAVLEIAYLAGDAIQWGSVTTSDGVKVTVPQVPSYLGHVKLARSGPKPLP